MSWRDDGSIKTVGQLIVAGAFVLGFTLWANSRGVLFNFASIWLTLMSAATMGMILAGHDSRRELAERRKAALNQHMEDYKDQEALAACTLHSQVCESILLHFKAFAARSVPLVFTYLGAQRERRPALNLLLT